MTRQLTPSPRLTQGPRQVATGRDIRTLQAGSSVSPVRWDDPLYGPSLTATRSRAVAGPLLINSQLRPEGAA
jgi:hypothetical protein